MILTDKFAPRSSDARPSLDSPILQVGLGGGNGDASALAMVLTLVPPLSGVERSEPSWSLKTGPLTMAKKLVGQMMDPEQTSPP